MRTQRETTYGMPTRVLVNADHGRTVQATQDHDAAHRACQHKVAERIEHRACRTERTWVAGLGVQAADTPRRPRPDDSDHVPTMPCESVRRWSPMQSGDGYHLTASRVASKQPLAVLP